MRWPRRADAHRGPRRDGQELRLAAIRDAHARDGTAGDRPGADQCRGAGPEGRGLHRGRHGAFGAVRLKNGRTSWDRRTVVVVDEAAMLDSRVTGELLAEARRAGAKVILAGDDRQLASIERGGLFTELRQRHGSAEISEITRQRDGLAAAGRARPGRRPVRRGGGGVRPGRGDHLDAGPGGRAQCPGRRLEARHRGGARRHAVRVRLHQPRRRCAERRAAPGAARSRRAARSGRAVRDEARAGGRLRRAIGCSSPTR